MCLFKIRHSTTIPESVTKHLGNIDHSLANIAKENREEEYTKHSNLISIGFTLLISSGTMFGAFILYSYLRDIEALSIFPSSLSNASLFGFSIIYLLINVFIYILIVLPSLIIYRNVHKEISKKPIMISIGYTIPMFVSLTFFLIFYIFEFNVKYATLTLLCVIICACLITLCFVWNTLKKENNKIDYQKLIETFSYIIFISFYSFLIITSINKGQDDFFYFSYAIIILFFTFLSNYLAVQGIKNQKTYFRKIAADNFILLTFSIIIIPTLIYQVSEIYNEFSDKKIKTTYSYKIMQVLGYADKNDKIYFIDEEFIEQEIKANPMKIYENVSMDNATIKNTYKAYCGRSYWKSSDTTVFKQNGDDSYKKIPNNKIFESQNTNFYCEDGAILKK